jgi:hypothetical protein
MTNQNKALAAVAVIVVAVLAAIALAVACDDDDADEDALFEPTSQEETATEEETVTPIEEEESTPPPTATEPENSDDDQAEGCPAPTPDDLLPAVLAGLHGGDPEAVFGCFSAEAQQEFGPTAADFENGAYTAFQEGLGTFPVNAPVIVAEEIAELDGIAVVAIAADREVEGTTENNAVYASLAVLEDGNWRLNPTDDYEVSSLDPPPFGSATAGDLAVTFDIGGIEDPGEGPGSMGVGEGLYPFFDGQEVEQGNIAAGFTAPGTFNYTVNVAAPAGEHTFVFIFIHDGLIAVEGWSFTTS